MSRSAILSALKTGPKTTAELLALRAGASSAYIARSCAELIKRGQIVRLDQRRGRGTRALYALTGHTAPPIATRRALHSADADQARHDPIPPATDRDPCSKCGTRADIGCKHRPSSLIEPGVP